MAKIFIDPGHGGTDTANRGPTGYVEAHGVLDIALRLKELLATNYEVQLSRELDITLSLEGRANKANAWGADLFVSIHTNAASPEAKGIETWHSKNGEWGTAFQAEAKQVALIVQEELVKATGFKDRGIKTRLVDNPGSPIHGLDYYAVIRKAKCPAIIIEAGFHTNPQEEALLKTSEFRQKVAEAIAAGIRRAYPVEALAPDIKEMGVQIGDKKLQGYLINDVGYAPIRGLVELLNKRSKLQLAWDEKTKTAMIT